MVENLANPTTESCHPPFTMYHKHIVAVCRQRWFSATVYAAGKAGVLGFTNALASEHASTLEDICVNAIVLGYIKTPMTRGEQGSLSCLLHHRHARPDRDLLFLSSSSLVHPAFFFLMLSVSQFPLSEALVAPLMIPYQQTHKPPRSLGLYACTHTSLPFPCPAFPTPTVPQHDFGNHHLPPPFAFFFLLLEK